MYEVKTIFCGGERSFNISSESGTFGLRYCLQETVGAFVAAIYTVLAVILTICLKKYGHQRRKLDDNHRKFYAHYWRAFLVTCLLASQTLEVGEYLALLETSPAPLYSLFSPLSSMAAVLCGLLLHSSLETRGLASCLPLEISFWLLMSIWRTLKVAHLTHFPLKWHHVMYTLSHADCLLLATLTATDVLTAYIEIGCKEKDSYNIFQRPIEARPPKQTCYNHNRACAFSQMTFWWMNLLLWRGYQDPIELEDLGSLPIEENAATQFHKFNEIYKKEQVASALRNTKPSLWKCYFRFIWPDYCLGGIFKLLGDSVGLVGPLGISIIIEYATGYSTTVTEKPSHNFGNFMTISEFMNNGYIMGIIVFLAAISQSTLSQGTTHLVNIEGIRLKAALQSLVYSKYLRLAPWSITEVQVIGDAPEQSSPEAAKDEKEDGNRSRDDTMDGSLNSNLISEDTVNIMSFVWIGHYIWAIPLKIGVLMYLLYLKLGLSAIIGATVCICLMTPLQFAIGKKMSSNSKLAAERSDLRMMKINEVLQGIKVLKMYGWEGIYGDKILEAREKELELLNKDSVYWTLITFLTHASSALITLVTFGLYFLLEEDQMTPANVFAGLALFNQLTVPLFIFPITVPIIISAMVSTDRLQEFLALPEINEKPETVNIDVSKPQSQSQDGIEQSATDVMKETLRSAAYVLSNIDETEEDSVGADDIFKESSSDEDSSSDSSLEDLNLPSETLYAVKISNAVFAWGQNEESSKICISDCLKIPKGKLTMIVGKTGSGKSSFLSALIGEMNHLKGKMTWSKNTSLAYAAQKPWLLNASIRENILFGSARHVKRYRRVLAACSLLAEVRALGETIEPGELAEPRSSIGNESRSGVVRGADARALSGGQRQRIALARALYSRAPVLLLDDPLAALDQTVAQKVFDRAIRRMCLKQGRTVVMVTHKLQLLSYADQIIYIDNGTARSMGSLANVEEMDPTLANEWRSLLSRGGLEEPSISKERNARGRWQVVRLVNRFSHLVSHTKPGRLDELGRRGSEEMFMSSFIPLRKRLPTFNGSKYFTHDIQLPAEDCDDDVLRRTAPKRLSTKRYKNQNRPTINNILNRTATKKHKPAERSSSLQVFKHKVKPAPMIRQSSSPAINCDPRAETDKSIRRPCGENGQQKYLLRQLLPMSSQKLIENPDEESQMVRQRSFMRRLLSRASSKKKSVSEPVIVGQERTPVQRLISTTSTISEDYNDDDDDNVVDNSICERLAPDEERKYGTIPKRVYLEYFRSCGTLAGSLYLGSAIAWQGMRVYTDVWLSDWTGRGTTKNESIDPREMTMYFSGYAVLSIVSITISFTLNAVGQYAGALARKKLHVDLLKNIIKCPVLFFETTPLGRIINRFSTDVGIIDKKIAISIQRLVQFLFMCMSAILINAVITPWFLIIAVPICVAYYIIQKFYRSSARELQRLDAITKSPVLSHFYETIGGLSSIRAFGQQERFTNEFWCKMDVNTNAFIILNSSDRWLGICLDYLGGGIVFAAINAALLSAKMYPETVTPSLVGLAINYTLLIPIYLNWVVKFLADMEMYMSAVERVRHYAGLPTEDYREKCDRLPEGWPTKGEVRLSGVTLRYGGSGDPVVHKVDLHVPAGQKLAICGRTGSGKSSLLLSLLQLVDVAEGSISVDDVLLKTVPLQQARYQLACVPQEGALFSGSVRENLQPGGEAAEQDMWKALEEAQLKETIASLPGGLDGIVSEGGAGWSVGERQRMEVARALLRGGSLLLLDEPTAALDTATERKLLPALATKSRTLITVAHRLSTILDYDRVIVMDAGRIVEDGSPKELLSRPMSIFSSMARATDE